MKRGSLVCVLLLLSCNSVDDLPPPFRYKQPSDADAGIQRIRAQVDDASTDHEVSDHADPSLVDAGHVAATTPEIEKPPISNALARLSHQQWARAAQQLLRLPGLPNMSRLIADPATDTGFDNTSDRLEVSPDLWRDYQSVGEQIAHEVATDPKQLARLGLGPDAKDAELHRFVGDLVERAFRRQPTQIELERYQTLFARAAELFSPQDSLRAGAELVIAALLQSPHFIYRTQLDNPADDSGVVRLSDSEIAARLSFMLWNAPPDDELLVAARAGRLNTAEQIVAQAARMLDAPLAAEKLVDFHRQWLSLSAYESVQAIGADADRIGALKANLGLTLRRETERFIQDVVVEHNGSLADVLQAKFTYVNRVNAPYYGLDGMFTDELVRVPMSNDQRGGLLTQVGFLASHSGPTAPILRGVFIVKKLLCATLPPPPKFDQPTVTGSTRRERVASITGPGTCGAGCHATIINPAGYPFEYFDDTVELTRFCGHPETRETARGVFHGTEETKSVHS